MTKEHSVTEKNHNRRGYKISLKRAKVAGIVCLSVVLVAIILMSPIFSIDSVVINKNDSNNTKEVEKALGFSKGDNIFAIDITDAQKRVEALDRVDSCIIERTLPGKVTVTINEKNESGYIKVAKGYAGVDETGKVMTVTKSKQRGIPMISGIIISEPKKNDYIKSDEKKGKQKTQTVIRVLASLKEHDLVSEVKTINVKDIKNLSLVLTTETVVNLGMDGSDNDDKLEYKIAFLKAILEKDDFKSGGIIELSDTENVTARMS
ncbi:MAG: FtsQ-type POTRA domain-containing protein [Clostridia bacterium]|nr:FtsQ-type POTRA domain-containing protein [Clostridia bacterium]